MCKKQTSVFHSSTESEIISLDAGLRLDGLLALEFWDLIVSVFRSVSQISDRTMRLVDVKRNHGLPALGLWDLVIEVLGVNHRRPKPTQACTRETGVEFQNTQD